jgi:hypothetical protein
MGHITVVFRVKQAATRRDFAEDLKLLLLNSLGDVYNLHDLVVK